MIQITLVLSVIVLSVQSAPGLHRRNRRSLGLIKLGYDTLVGDGGDTFLGGILSGAASPFNDLSTLQKIGVSIPMAKAVGLGLLGKCKTQIMHQKEIFLWIVYNSRCPV